MTNQNNNQSQNDFINVAVYLKKMAEIQPYGKAVICPESRDSGGRVTYTHLTFQQLDKESDRLAGAFESIGIARGTRTVLMVKPSIDFFILIFSLFKSGAIPVVVDPGMGLKKMVACLKKTKPQAFIGIPAAHLLRKLYPRSFKTVKTCITVGRRLFWSGHSLKKLMRTPFKLFEIAKTLRHDTAAILFTTGSTGPAKGAIYTYGNFDAQLRHIQAHLNMQPNESDLSTFPLFALFWPAFGITSIIPDMDAAKPAKADPQKLIESIKAHGITNMFASPALLNRIGIYGASKGIKLPSLKRVISAGAPVSPQTIELFQFMLTDGAQIHTPYGATEAVPIISITSDEILSETKMLSEQGYGICVGRPINDIDIRIINISDGPIEKWSPDLVIGDSEIGEIVVCSEHVSTRYYDNPEADALSKIHDNDRIWHRMGDLGWKDSQGRIWFCGRKSHRVVTHDKIMFTIPCESIFNNHPQVFRSALVGVGSAPNQKPVICIELEKGVTFSRKMEIKKELLELARSTHLTSDIDTILFHKSFPVDIRHNSKIFREKLKVWAEKRLR